MSNELTQDGQQLVKIWLQSQAAIANAKRELSRIECDARNAESALIKWMLPPDAKPGEKIAVWFLDALIQVEVGGVSQGNVINGVGPAPTESKVTIRSRGKHFEELAWR